MHLVFCSGNYCGSIVVYTTGMFTEAEQVISLAEKEQSYKINLIKLKAIKDRLVSYEKECFCSSVRRKIWLKDFKQWYETYT
jgi:fructose-1,6-bisphosphatase